MNDSPKYKYYSRLQWLSTGESTTSLRTLSVCTKMQVFSRSRCIVVVVGIHPDNTIIAVFIRSIGIHDSRLECTQPSLYGGIILQILSKGVVLQGGWEAGLQGFPSPRVIGQAVVAAHHVLEQSDADLSL